MVLVDGSKGPDLQFSGPSQFYIINEDLPGSDPELSRLQKALRLETARERRWRRIVWYLFAAVVLNLTWWVLYFFYLYKLSHP